MSFYNTDNLGTENSVLEEQAADITFALMLDQQKTFVGVAVGEYVLKATDLASRSLPPPRARGSLATTWAARTANRDKQ